MSNLKYVPPSFTYIDRFRNWGDIQNAYGMLWGEPEKVYAAYHGGDTKMGVALIFYRHKGRYFYQENFTDPVPKAAYEPAPDLIGQWEPSMFTRVDFLEHVSEFVEFYPDDDDDLEIHIAKAVLRMVEAENEKWFRA